MENNNKKDKKIKKEESEFIKPVIYLIAIIAGMWLLSLFIK